MIYLAGTILAILLVGMVFSYRGRPSRISMYEIKTGLESRRGEYE